jgi:hypothetical protein
MTRKHAFAALFAASLAFPAAASADSIVYLDGGNVWSAAPDGSHRVQLTDGGDWHSPTQADDGTLAAVEGTGPIVVMARDGRVLHTITTPPARSADGGTFAPHPVQLAFSPDGSKLAYAYLAYSCPVASTCGSIQRSTFYTRADVTEATPIDVWGNQFSVSDPSWVTNDRTLVSGGAGSQVDVDDLGGGDYSFVNWLNPPTDEGDPELSRDGRHLATTYDYGDNTRLRFYAVDGPVGASPPTLACFTTHPDARYGSPTWGPDGMGIAFETSSGVEVTRFARLDAGGCEMSDFDVQLGAGTSSPDWGPADPPAARYVAPAPGVPAPPVPAATPAPKLTVVAGAAKQRFRGSVKVTCTAGAAGTCTATVKARGKTARASAKVAAGRRATITVRFGKAAARALRGRRLNATVTVVARAADGRTATARTTAKLTP